jgi:hypothetical protein
VILIFSVNMSGHFQGYAQMISAIGQRRANVWSEASWGGTFSVEWIQLYDLPFQKTLHLKNPLNSFKPVKISRDCQVYTAAFIGAYGCVRVHMCNVILCRLCRNLLKKLERLCVP